MEKVTLARPNLWLLLLVGLFAIVSRPLASAVPRLQAEQLPSASVNLGNEEFQNNRASAKQHLDAGQPARAVPFLEKARSLNPSDFANGYDLSKAYMQTGQLEKARAEATNLLRIRDTADVHTLLGDIETVAQSPKAAAAQYQIAAQMDPSEDRIFDFGQSLLTFESDAAIRIFSYGVEKYPKSSRLRIGLGAAFEVHGNSDKAAEALCQAVDMNPADPTPIDFLGGLLNVSPQAAQQVNQRLDRLLKIQPENPDLNYYLARNLLNPVTGQPSKEEMARAERLLKTAIRLNPKLTNAHFELGRLFEMEDRQHEAESSYEHAIKLDPSQAKYHYRLSLVYRALGKTNMAAQEVHTFQRLQAASEVSDAPGAQRGTQPPLK
jgi:tetratricopeptide (TPR) repeat protein